MFLAQSECFFAISGHALKVCDVCNYLTCRSPLNLTVINHLVSSHCLPVCPCIVTKEHSRWGQSRAKERLFGLKLGEFMWLVFSCNGSTAVFWLGNIRERSIALHCSLTQSVTEWRSVISVLYCDISRIWIISAVVHMWDSRYYFWSIIKGEKRLSHVFPNFERPEVTHCFTFYSSFNHQIATESFWMHLIKKLWPQTCVIAVTLMC